MSNCASFGDGRLRSDRDLTPTMVDAESCPVCTPDLYDPDKLRLVKSMNSGVLYGWSPPKHDAGVQLHFCCCTVM